MTFSSYSSSFSSFRHIGAVNCGVWHRTYGKQGAVFAVHDNVHLFFSSSALVVVYFITPLFPNRASSPPLGQLQEDPLSFFKHFWIFLRVGQRRKLLVCARCCVILSRFFLHSDSFSSLFPLSLSFSFSLSLSCY